MLGTERKLRGRKRAQTKSLRRPLHVEERLEKPKVSREILLGDSFYEISARRTDLVEARVTPKTDWRRMWF
jgi:hypothetical protein